MASDGYLQPSPEYDDGSSKRHDETTTNQSSVSDPTVQKDLGQYLTVYSECEYSSVDRVDESSNDSSMSDKTIQEDSGEYIPVYAYSYVDRVDESSAESPPIRDLPNTNDDEESTQVANASPENGMKARKGTLPNKLYKNYMFDEYTEIRNVDHEYAEIPGEFQGNESLREQRNVNAPQGTSILPFSSAPKTLPAPPVLPGEPQHQPCCRKSTRFWCLLTAGLSTLIVMLVVVLLTGTDSFFSFFFYIQEYET